MATAPTTQGHKVDEHTMPPFLRRVRIRGYKSIGFCDVRLQPLTILVGRNAAGKSNFLDALAFLRDVVVRGVHEAVKRHGGRDAVLSQFTSSSIISIEIEVGYQPQGEAEFWTGLFAVEIALPKKELPRLIGERVRVGNSSGNRWTGYQVQSGRVAWSGDSYSHPVHEWMNSDKVLLTMYGIEPFLKLFEGIESIETYNFSPEAIRRPQKASPGKFLERDGCNLASVIETTREVEEWAIERASDYLFAITNAAEFAGVVESGGYETLQFRVPLEYEDMPRSIELPAASMSDGTLRAFAAVMAAFQRALPHGSPSVVAIEEPEIALHPAAMRALADALDEATERTQVLLTTHSADLLSGRDVTPGQVLVVRNRGGRTQITPVDPASREIVEKELYSLADLQRMDKLDVDEADLERQSQLSRQGGA